MKSTLNQNNNPLVNISEISVRPVDKTELKAMMEQNHYLGLLPKTTPICLGVFKNGIKEPIGGLMFGPLGGRQTLSGMFTKTEIFTKGDRVFCPSNMSVLELKRMYIHEARYNIESRVIKLCFDWLRENHPEIRVLVAYSDPSFKHRGTIYQSTNWLYQEVYKSTKSNEFRVCFKPEDERGQGDWVHSRSLEHRYGKKSIDVLKRKRTETFWKQKEGRKYRYVIFLHKREKEKLVKHLVHPIRPYPKEVCAPYPIEEITVTE